MTSTQARRSPRASYTCPDTNIQRDVWETPVVLSSEDSSGKLCVSGGIAMLEKDLVVLVGPTVRQRRQILHTTRPKSAPTSLRQYQQSLQSRVTPGQYGVLYAASVASTFLGLCCDI